MTTGAHLNIGKILARFGGPAGLQARLSNSGYLPTSLSPATVRVWKTRNSIPAHLALPVLLALRDAGENPFDFVVEPETEINPFEGIM